MDKGRQRKRETTLERWMRIPSLTREDFIGSILGSAIGDALGAPAEFRSLEEIRKKWGTLKTFVSWGEKDCMRPGRWTDDTEMTLAVARGLVAAKDHPLSIKHVMHSITLQFVTWRNTHDPRRAPGSSCLKGCARLKQLQARQGKEPWRVSGVPSDGCGTVMRVSPIGLFYNQNLRMLVHVADTQAQATHRSPSAANAAVAAAVLVARARATDLQEAVDMAGFMVVSRKIKSILKQALRWWEKDKAEDEVLDHWRGWDAASALGASVFLALKYQQSYLSGVVAAINSPGDSDSLGAITGAILGARHGLLGLPRDLVAQVESGEEIRQIAEQLWEAQEG